MRNVTFTPEAFDSFNAWASRDKQAYRKIVKLIDDTLRQPFTGLGKPKPLKHELKGYWSRRITDEHRYSKLPISLRTLISSHYLYANKHPSTFTKIEGCFSQSASDR